jgi:hypothetical protein
VSAGEFASNAPRLQERLLPRLAPDDTHDMLLVQDISNDVEIQKRISEECRVPSAQEAVQKESL